MEEMKFARRLDDVDPNMELNSALIDKFHKVGIRLSVEENLVPKP